MPVIIRAPGAAGNGVTRTAGARVAGPTTPRLSDGATVLGAFPVEGVGVGMSDGTRVAVDAGEVVGAEAPVGLGTPDGARVAVDEWEVVGAEAPAIGATVLGGSTAEGLGEIVPEETEAGGTVAEMETVSFPANDPGKEQ